MKREHLPGRIDGGIGRPRLGEVGHVTLGMVIETTDTGKGAVVVVERAVLLHEEDDVVDGPQIGPGRLDGRGTIRRGATARGQEHGGGPAGTSGQDLSAGVDRLMHSAASR